MTRSAETLSGYLRPLRGQQRLPVLPGPPKVREVVGWLTRHPDGLSDQESQRRKDVLARCPELDTAAGHVTAFAQMMSTS